MYSYSLNRLVPQTIIHALLALSIALFGCGRVKGQQGARLIDFYGYSDCISLSNEKCEAILCPAAGGRVLSYALDGKNVLYLPAGDEGWTWDGKPSAAPMHAGRFDIGPEQIVPKRPVLWQGKWQGEIIGDRKAIMRSQTDAATGVRLERTFELDRDSSQLSCQQTIINTSQRTVAYCHWSRTFANGKGTCIVPVSKPSRFPQFYVRYDPPGKLINMAPNDSHIELVDDLLVINDRPENPKLGFDSTRGWLAYHSPQDLLFVKKFPTYPDRVYNEVAGLTISIWYPDGEMVELEPIGPRERLEPNQSASFVETWYLLSRPFPSTANSDPKAIARLAESLGSGSR